jgi:hypothetical protein
MGNTLYYGDNLDVLREYVRDETVDLIYLDPPFNSQVQYNVLFRTPAGDAAELRLKRSVISGAGTRSLKQPTRKC